MIELSSYQIKKLEHLYNMLDVNNSGALGYMDGVLIVDRIIERRNWEDGGNEAKTFYRKFMASWRRMIFDMDQNRDLVIDFKEWLDYHKIISKDPVVFELDMQTIVGALLHIADSNADGFLDLEEFKSLFPVYKIDDNDFQAHFESLDLNHDGLLSRDEIVKHLMDFYLCQDEVQAVEKSAIYAMIRGK